MKYNRMFITLSMFIIPLIFGIVFIDLAGTFSYSDFAFGLALLLYAIFLFIQRSTSRATFLLAIFFLIWMGLSYVPTGAGTVTERIGEWFYIFYVVGLIQYLKEVYESKG